MRDTTLPVWPVSYARLTQVLFGTEGMLPCDYSEVCAFEHLHERHIIYRRPCGPHCPMLLQNDFLFEHLKSFHSSVRDLKPENLLLNEKGHLKVTLSVLQWVGPVSLPDKVTDMGLAKFVIGKACDTLLESFVATAFCVSSDLHDLWHSGLFRPRSDCVVQG